MRINWVKMKWGTSQVIVTCRWGVWSLSAACRGLALLFWETQLEPYPSSPGASPSLVVPETEPKEPALGGTPVPAYLPAYLAACDLCACRKALGPAGCVCADGFEAETILTYCRILFISSVNAVHAMNWLFLWCQADIRHIYFWGRIVWAR